MDTGKEREPPVRLYKYYSLDDSAPGGRESAQERTERVIRTSKVFFANPIRHFNDPFDCRLDFRYEGTTREWASRVKRLDERSGLSRTRQQRRVIARRARENAKKDVHKEKFFRIVAESNSLYCLSEANDNILMYSHYADSHRGICVGLSTDRLVSYLDNQAKDYLAFVEYPDDFNPPNWVKCTSEQRVKWVLFTKAKDWSYEMEWRIVRPTPSTEVQLPDDAIVEIIFGCQIDKKKEEAIRSANAARRYPANLLRAKKKTFAIGLEIVPA